MSLSPAELAQISALALGLGNFERMRAHDVHLLAASLSPRSA